MGIFWCTNPRLFTSSSGNVATETSLARGGDWTLNCKCVSMPLRKTRLFSHTSQFSFQYYSEINANIDFIDRIPCRAAYFRSTSSLHSLLRNPSQEPQVAGTNPYFQRKERPTPTCIGVHGFGFPWKIHDLAYYSRLTTRTFAWCTSFCKYTLRFAVALKPNALVIRGKRRRK